MTGSERGFSGYALGGYRPDAGLTPAKAAGVQKIPVPSLLRSLLTEHLDPGYAAAAARRSAEPPAGRPRIPNWVWQALAALLIAAVFAAAMAQARSVAAGDRATQHGLAAGVKSAEVTVEQLTAQRNQLAAELDAVQRRQLDDDAEGRELLAALDGLTLAAAGAALIGPGLTVTVTEPANPPDLTDVSKQRVLGSQQVILDRDLQLVVNGLWAAGAEAVSVGGVRVGPAVTIRQAGGAILVDNHPITNPYAIVALGPPNTLRDGFESSSGMTRLQLLAASYGVGVGVQTDDALTVPAGTARELEFARRSGS